MTNKTKDAAPEVPEVQEQGDENPSLSVTDLSNIKQIIDVATQRGAFKANEFQMVGVVYDRLSAFLDKMAPAGETPPAPETPEV